ncbi:histone acetyltransferase type B subunit 2 [Sporormia fimetaria CBS 119925]|uniref:Histone acetyltransferase type B subunit 2 n=1 Tax=Sporormia fimetaria CBS 119925 TaxID=1340428 RepID=A0A6A6V388_9PLEO|nr:histone acetyltransferase type B subunit 2 [Sporormia fimetaria CBS 119925]
MDEPMSDAPLDEREQQAHEDEELIAHNKAINEEYKIWKKNSVFLYDVMYGRALEWPTLTTQWLPDKRPVEGTNFTAQRILLGTHTSNQAQNYIQIAQVEMPDTRPPDIAELDEQRGEFGGHGNAKKPFEFKVIQTINHPGEVNKARYQPQNPDIIASLSVDGRVLIFDRTKHPLKPKDDGTIKTEAELIGHEQEGFGLCWSPLKQGHIVTGNEDCTVRTWDLQAGFSKTNSCISPSNTYTHHTSTVNDVQYHPAHASLIGSVSDDLTWTVIDTRMSPSQKALYRKENAHTDAVNSIAFHPEWEMIMATGSADKSIGIWDLRMFKDKTHSLEGHKDAVMGLQWHPQDSAILASSSYDRRICMWDLSKIGEEQTPEEAEDGPPELLFMHGGFTGRVSDMDWNKNDPWVMLAAAEDNQLQIFRPARKLVEPVKLHATHEQVSD